MFWSAATRKRWAAGSGEPRAPSRAAPNSTQRERRQTPNQVGSEHHLQAPHQGGGPGTQGAKAAPNSLLRGTSARPPEAPGPYFVVSSQEPKGYWFLLKISCSHRPLSEHPCLTEQRPSPDHDHGAAHGRARPGLGSWDSEPPPHPIPRPPTAQCAALASGLAWRSGCTHVGRI